MSSETALRGRFLMQGMKNNAAFLPFASRPGRTSYWPTAAMRHPASAWISGNLEGLVWMHPDLQHFQRKAVTGDTLHRFILQNIGDPKAANITDNVKPLHSRFQAVPSEHCKSTRRQWAVIPR